MKKKSQDNDETHDKWSGLAKSQGHPKNQQIIQLRYRKIGHSCSDGNS